MNTLPDIDKVCYRGRDATVVGYVYKGYADTRVVIETSGKRRFTVRPSRITT